MADPAPKLDWTRFIPDARIWIVAGMFALSWRLLYMIAEKPDLLNSAPFMTVVTLVLGTGGLGAVVAFYYGGTRTGSNVMEAQSEALVANAAPTVQAPGTTTTSTTTAAPTPPVETP